MAFAFVGFNNEELPLLLFRFLFGLMFSLIILKTGLRCLLGATVGVVVLTSVIVGFAFLLISDGSWAPAWRIIFQMILPGAAIGAGIHGARIEHGARQPERSGTAHSFSVERVAMIPIGLVLIWPAWLFAFEITKRWPSSTDWHFWIAIGCAISGAIAGAKFLSLLVGLFGPQRKVPSQPATESEIPAP